MNNYTNDKNNQDNQTHQSRYTHSFSQLTTKKEGAFVPFVVIGDPDFETSYDILVTLIESGADALELGIPFSDPLADGPEIQTAVLRAFAGGITVEKCFTLLKRIRANYPHIPIGLLMYTNLVHKNGVDHFYARCAKAGVDSVLVADAPIREYSLFHQSAIKYGIDPIFICPPNATDDTIKQIAKLGTGYTYLVSRSGVTGMETEANHDLTHNIKRLQKAGAPPIVQGFGIGTPEQAKNFINSGVDGVISGSAVTRIIRDNVNDKKILLTKLAEFIRQMKEATRPEKKQA